jgi:tetratricopeptide (TPR) repeat protein
MLGAILLDASRIIEARTALEATLADLDETVDAAVRAEVLSNLSRALMRSDEAAPAVEMADRALAIAERLDLELIVAEAFNNKGSSLGYLGRRREAVALLEAAVRVAQAGGFVGAELRALANLASIVSGDDPRRSREVDREGLALARRVGHRMMANWLVGNVLVDAFIACDGWDVVVAEGEEALAAVTDPGDEQRITAFVTLLRICRGEPTDAAIARIEELLKATSDPGDEQILRVLRALRHSLAGELGRAYDEAMGGVDLFSAFAQACVRIAGRAAMWDGDLERARAVAERAGRLPDTGTPMRLLRTGLAAGIAALEGRRAEAIAAFRGVVGEALERGDGFEAANEALTAVVLLGTDEPSLRALADEARRLFERVGARSYLARLDGAIAGPPVASAALRGVGGDDEQTTETTARSMSADRAPTVT